MPGLVPGIHAFSCSNKDVDGIATRACPSCALLTGASRIYPTCADKPGHDDADGSRSNAAGVKPSHETTRPASVPIPKFASLCGTLVCELRNRRTLATY